MLGAAISWAVMGLGNFIEDVMGLAWGGDLFTVGIAAFGLSAAAGVVTLTAPGRWRWSGLFLLGMAAGLGFDAYPFGAITWVVMAIVLWRGIFEEAAEAG